MKADSPHWMIKQKIRLKSVVATSYFSHNIADFITTAMQYSMQSISLANKYEEFFLFTLISLASRSV